MTWDAVIVELALRRVADKMMHDSQLRIALNAVADNISALVAEREAAIAATVKAPASCDPHFGVDVEKMKE